MKILFSEYVATDKKAFVSSFLSKVYSEQNHTFVVDSSPSVSGEDFVLEHTEEESSKSGLIDDVTDTVNIALSVYDIDFSF